MLLYLLFAQDLHTYFFLEQGKPARVDESLPKEMKEITLKVDGLDQVILQKEELYTLWGWAFLESDTALPPHMYKREIVLTSGSKTYFFSTNSVERLGVQDAFEELNLDLTQSGFSTLISKDVLPLGEYRVGMIFIDPSTGSAYYSDKPRVVLLREPNGLSLSE